MYHCDKIEPMSSNRYKLTISTIEDSDQSAHHRSLIGVFDGRSMTQGLNYPSVWKRRFWSDCVDSHVDLSLRRADNVK